MGAAEKIVQEAIEQLDDNQRKLVLAWAQKAQEISNSADFSKLEKLKLFQDLETGPSVNAFTIALVTVLKRKLWNERSWPARGALSGLFIGVVGLGGQGAGIVAMGGAVGVPLFLLTTAGGALLGTIVMELTKPAKDRDTK